MEKVMGEEGGQDRALRALQVAFVSDFLKGSLGLQLVCLSLCNAYREGLPVQRLKISSRGPPAFLAMLCPDVYHPEVEAVSRVEPPRTVLKVEFRNSRWAPATHRDYDKLGEAVKAHLRTIPEPCVDNVRWPTGTKEIYLTCQSESIDQVVWPEDLEVLSFCLPLQACKWNRVLHNEVFNSPLDGARFPSGLREIFMGSGFNQSIEGVSWPEGLERLSLPGFDQPIQGVRWPTGLKSLEFMPPSEIRLRKDPYAYRENLTFSKRSFNQALTSALPASLETLWLSDCFDQSLDGDVLPRGLICLGVGVAYPSTSFSGVLWPPGLRNVYTMNGLDADDNPLPDGCSMETFTNEEDEEELEARYREEGMFHDDLYDMDMDDDGDFFFDETDY